MTTEDIREETEQDLSVDDFRPPSPIYAGLYDKEAPGVEFWPDDPMEAEQLRRELEGWVNGIDTVRARWTKALDDGDPLRTPVLNRLVNRFLEPLADRIAGAASRCKKGGRPPEWYRMAHESIPKDAATHLADITLRTILPYLLVRTLADKPVTFIDLAARVGAGLEHAANDATWKERNPGLYRSYVRRMDERGNTQRHRQANMRRGYNKHVRDEEGIEPWGQSLRVRVGGVLADAALKATRIGQRVRVEAKKVSKRRDIVVLDAKILEWCGKEVNELALRASVSRSMVCEPVRWIDGVGGGFLRQHYVRSKELIRLVRDGSAGPHVTKAITQALGAEPPQSIYAAVNLLQSTQFSINGTVSTTAREATRAGLKLDDLPDSYIEEIPRRPQGLTKEQEESKEFKLEVKKWKDKKSAAIAGNVKRVSKALWSRMVQGEALEIWALLKDKGPIWFAHRACFRGRLYNDAAWLAPQGSSLGRHMLQFHRGKPIGGGDGPRHLAVQVAKAFGQDHLTWDERITWTHEHTDMLKRIADDPLGHRGEWEGEAGMDNIWPALAASREWTDYVAMGKSPNFITTLPCYVDGTCNGIQHYAALSRNQGLARSVNLAPGNQKRDIYQEVANTTFDLVERQAAKGTPEEREKAKLWLIVFEGKAPRSLTKKIVMTKAYGSTSKTARDEVYAYLDKVDKKRTKWEKCGVEEWTLVGWLVKQINAAMKERLGAAEAIMAWLVSAMKLLHDHRGIEKLDWKSPAGWPWRNVYYMKTIDKVRYMLDQKRKSSSVAVDDISKIDIKQVKQAVAPNFVHALDSAALCLALGLIADEGIRDVTAIHDSVGGLAPDMTTISKCIREGFVRCHEERPLEDFREAVLRALPNDEARAALAPLPPVGTFDVREVLDSTYFFS